jgi:hypothetical protein
MKSIIQKLLFLKYIFIFIFSFALLYSCKDDPVNPPPIPQDTSDIYDWKVIDVGGILVDVYVADSLNVYLNTGTIPYLYNGDTVQPFDLHDPTFILNGINGFDKNNIFFGGGNPNVTRNPSIKKYSYGSITTYTINTDSTYYIGSMLVEGPDRAWIGTQGGRKVYYFDSGIFSEYILDDTLLFPFFYRDNQGSLYIFANTKENGKEYLSVYKNVSNIFEFIRKDLISYPSEKIPLLYECGSDLVMTADRNYYNKLYYFNGYDWIYYMTSDFSISKLGGKSKNNLIALNIHPSIWIYNEEKWDKEDSLILNIYGSYYSYGGHIKIKDDRVYFVMQFQNLDSKLIIGKLNK